MRADLKTLCITLPEAQQCCVAGEVNKKGSTVLCWLVVCVDMIGRCCETRFVTTKHNQLQTEPKRSY